MINKIYAPKNIGKKIFILLVVGPTFLGYMLFTLYPNIMSVYYSMLEWDGISKARFVGLYNFTEMIKDRFLWRALYHNSIMILVIPIFTVIISVFIADLMVNRTYKENNFYKVLFFSPNILSVVVLALIWSFIYDGQFGLLNAILKPLGINMGNYSLLGDEKLALFALMVPLIWINVSFYMVIYMNAMRAIPKSLYESAVLEGITNTKRLFTITVPLISGVIRVSVILMVIIVFKGFEMVMILTRGGPGGATDVIGYYMFNFAFGTSNTGMGAGSTNYGYASAIGMLLFIILVSCKLIVDRFFTQETIEY